MKDVIEVREAVLADCSAIYGFVCALENTEFDFIMFQRILTENLGNKHNIYLVALSNKEPVGFLSCHSQLLLHHNARVGEIQELYVDEAFRSRQIGQVLLFQLETIAIQRDIASLEVTSGKKRIQAHRFYTRRGYKETHVKFTKEVL